MVNEGLHSVGKGMRKVTPKIIRQIVLQVTRDLARVMNDSRNLAYQKLINF